MHHESHKKDTRTKCLSVYDLKSCQCHHTTNRHFTNTSHKNQKNRLNLNNKWLLVSFSVKSKDHIHFIRMNRGTNTCHSQLLSSASSNIQSICYGIHKKLKRLGDAIEEIEELDKSYKSIIDELGKETARSREKRNQLDTLQRCVVAFMRSFRENNKVITANQSFPVLRRFASELPLAIEDDTVSRQVLKTFLYNCIILKNTLSDDKKGDGYLYILSEDNNLPVEMTDNIKSLMKTYGVNNVKYVVTECSVPLLERNLSSCIISGNIHLILQLIEESKLKEIMPKIMSTIVLLPTTTRCEDRVRLINNIDELAKSIGCRFPEEVCRCISSDVTTMIDRWLKDDHAVAAFPFNINTLVSLQNTISTTIDVGNFVDWLVGTMKSKWDGTGFGLYNKFTPLFVGERPLIGDQHLNEIVRPIAKSATEKHVLGATEEAFAEMQSLSRLFSPWRRNELSNFIAVVLLGISKFRFESRREEQQSRCGTQNNRKGTPP